MGGRTKAYSNLYRQKAKVLYVVYFRLIKSFGETETEIGEINRRGKKKSVD